MEDDNSNGFQKSDDDVYMAPHVLAMSATPIPRTLALALYGDMSLTEVFNNFCPCDLDDTHPFLFYLEAKPLNL